MEFSRYDKNLIKIIERLQKKLVKFDECYNDFANILGTGTNYFEWENGFSNLYSEVYDSIYDLILLLENDYCKQIWKIAEHNNTMWGMYHNWVHNYDDAKCPFRPYKYYSFIEITKKLEDEYKKLNLL